MGSIRRNAEAFSALTGVKLCAVVKANAYGHGAEAVVDALSTVADSFAVALIEEAIAIRAVAHGKEILVLTPPTTEEEAYLLAVNGFTATVSGLDTVRLLHTVCRKFRLRARVHIKVNTGMNRYGVEPNELEKLCKALASAPFVQVTGMYSHLYTTDLETSKIQRQRFLVAEEICKRKFPSVTAHLSATFGATLGKDYAFDMVRIGIGLYGYSPVETGLGLEKGMTVYAKGILEREYEFGGAGYGLAQVKKGESLGVLRLGYADGFLRKRENGADGWQSNVNCLCMDACIKKGGIKQGVFIPVMTDAEKTAKVAGTIAYEVLCAVTRRAEFVYEEN